MQKIFFVITGIFFPFLLFAQTEEFAAEDIKTARIRIDGADFSFPVCVLGQTLCLDFDVLDSKRDNL